MYGKEKIIFFFLRKTVLSDFLYGHVESIWKTCQKSAALVQKFSVRTPKIKIEEKYFFLKKLFPSKPASRHLVCSHGNYARKLWHIFIKNPKVFDSKSKSNEKGPYFFNEFFQSLPSGYVNEVMATQLKFFHQTVEKSSLWAWNYCIYYTSYQNVFFSLKRNTGHVDFRPDNFAGAFCWKYGKSLHKYDIVKKNYTSIPQNFPLCT